MSLTGGRKYCVFGCNILDAYMHRFPHPERQPELHKKWVSVVGDKLKDMDPWKIYTNKKICDYHFTPDQKLASHRLMYNAYPCINLNGSFAGAAGILVQIEHNYSFLGIQGSTCSSTQQKSLEATLNKVSKSSITTGSQSNPISCKSHQSSRSPEAEVLRETEVERFQQSNSNELLDQNVSTSSLQTSPDETVTDIGHGVEALEAVALRDRDDVSMYQDDDLIYDKTVSDTDQCYACNECKETIMGFRYTCVQCADWDLCGACEARAAHAAHYVLRIPSARPYNEIQAVLAAIRYQLLSEVLFPDMTERLTDVKSEPEEPSETAELDPLGDWDDGDNVIEPDIIPNVTEDAEHAPTRKRPRLGSPHSSEQNLPPTPESYSKFSRDSTTVAHYNPTKSAQDIQARRLPNNPSNPIVKLIRQTTRGAHPTRGVNNPRPIPTLKPVAEASVPLEIRVIKQRAVAGNSGNPTSRLRRGEPITSRLEDKLVAHGAERSTATTTVVTTTSNKLERPVITKSSLTKSSSRVFLRVPIGSSPADVVKALQCKAVARDSVREEKNSLCYSAIM